jgi:hypothetical protein
LRFEFPLRLLILKQKKLGETVGLAVFSRNAPHDIDRQTNYIRL